MCVQQTESHHGRPPVAASDDDDTTRVSGSNGGVGGGGHKRSSSILLRRGSSSDLSVRSSSNSNSNNNTKVARTTTARATTTATCTTTVNNISRMSTSRSVSFAENHVVDCQEYDPDDAASSVSPSVHNKPVEYMPLDSSLYAHVHQIVYRPEDDDNDDLTPEQAALMIQTCMRCILQRVRYRQMLIDKMYEDLEDSESSNNQDDDIDDSMFASSSDNKTTMRPRIMRGCSFMSSSHDDDDDDENENESEHSDEDDEAEEDTGAYSTTTSEQDEQQAAAVGVGRVVLGDSLHETVTTTTTTPTQNDSVVDDDDDASSMETEPLALLENSSEATENVQHSSQWEEPNHDHQVATEQSLPTPTPPQDDGDVVAAAETAVHSATENETPEEEKEDGLATTMSLHCPERYRGDSARQLSSVSKMEKRATTTSTIGLRPGRVRGDSIRNLQVGGSGWDSSFPAKEKNKSFSTPSLRQPGRFRGDSYRNLPVGGGGGDSVPEKNKSFSTGTRRRSRGNSKRSLCVRKDSFREEDDNKRPTTTTTTTTAISLLQLPDEIGADLFRIQKISDHCTSTPTTTRSQDDSILNYYNASGSRSTLTPYVEEDDWRDNDEETMSDCYSSIFEEELSVISSEVVANDDGDDHDDVYGDLHLDNHGKDGKGIDRRDILQFTNPYVTKMTTATTLSKSDAEETASLSDDLESDLDQDDSNNINNSASAAASSGVVVETRQVKKKLGYYFSHGDNNNNSNNNNNKSSSMGKLAAVYSLSPRRSAKQQVESIRQRMRMSQRLASVQ